MTGEPYSPDRPKRTVAYGPLIWGAILVVIGTGWLLAALDIASLPWRALLAVILIVIGIASATAYARDGSAGGLFGAGVTISIVLALLSTFSSAFSLPLSGGFGERAYSPTIATLDAGYSLVAGQMKLDLGDVDFPVGDTHLEVGITFGTIDVTGISDAVAVSVDGRATAGELSLFGSHWDGVNVRASSADPGFDSAERRLIIDARVGFGQIVVRR
jgi:predicted membrane protein